MGGSKHICIDPIYDRNPPSTYWTSLTSTFPELDRAMAFSQLARCRRRGPGGNMCGRRLGVKGFMGSREIKTKIEWILWIRSNFASNISLPLGDLKPWWLRGRQKSLGSRWRTWQRSGTNLNAFGNTWGTTLRKLCFMTISRFVWLMLQRHTFFYFGSNLASMCGCSYATAAASSPFEGADCFALPEGLQGTRWIWGHFW